MPDQHIPPAPMYIDPHIHMISRTTDDYQRMAKRQAELRAELATRP